MSDAERLDWLERTMRQQIGGNTVEQFISCEVYMG